MTKSKPLILISNDDGVHADGLKSLAEALGDVGEVWVVAPDRERSAVSHGISLHAPLRIFEVGQRTYKVNGYPADCVYLALQHLLPKRPDLIVSGINAGPNLGNDVLYSGTVAAAMEGALYGVRAVAISLVLQDPAQCHPGDDFFPHFETAAAFAVRLAGSVLQQTIPPGVVLNVNVPNLPVEKVRGVKLCRLGYTDWADVVTQRADPRGRPYYWIGGERVGDDHVADSDIRGITAAHVTITPLHYDLTDYRSFGWVRKLNADGFEWAGDGLGEGPLPYPHAYKSERSQ